MAYSSPVEPTSFRIHTPVARTHSYALPLGLFPGITVSLEIDGPMKAMDIHIRICGGIWG